MKRLLFIAALLSAVMQLTAANIDVATAQSAAQRFLQGKSASQRFNGAQASNISLLHAEASATRADQAAYYIFNGENGFVIVSGDDRAQEILAYGVKPITDFNSLPDNMRFWLDYYKQQIEYLQAHPGMMFSKPALKAGGTSVEPMITATWDQGYPYYSQCPMDGDRRGLTGCAATSLAQVFNKWKYPTGPTPVVPGYTTATRGFVLAPLPSVTFDWENILDAYRVGYYNEANHNAIAQLMRYIGQAEEMDYTNEGSEAYQDDILRACHLFGYVNAYVSYKSKINFYTREDSIIIEDDEWNEMLQAELIAGRPVVYCAYSYSGVYDTFYGHAFNVDGYDATTGLYSINWGWSGTGNGYFALNAFANQGYSYTMGQLMVMGIEPPAPIEAYDPVMQPADSAYISLNSFRADWTDETPAENVTSYTLEVSTEGGGDPGVYEKVFTESFPYASSNGSRPISKLDSYCSNAGWTGSYVYESRGGLRLGGDGNLGTLTTPALNMTQSGGKMTIVATMKPYSSDTDVPVTISCGSSIASVTVSAEGTQSIVLECDADENQKVTFSTSVGSKRVVITQVDIYSATVDAAKMVFAVPAETGDAESRVITGITDKYYTVRGLAEGGTFYYKVKAMYVNGTESAWSNIEEVTLFGTGHDFEPGDVDHNHEVTIGDVTLLLNYLLTGEGDVCSTCADMNADGEIAIVDVTMLINLLLTGE